MKPVVKTLAAINIPEQTRDSEESDVIVMIVARQVFVFCFLLSFLNFIYRHTTDEGVQEWWSARVMECKSGGVQE